MIQLVSSVERALGAHVRAEDLTIPQIALRATLVFLVWLVLVSLLLVGAIDLAERLAIPWSRNSRSRHLVQVQG